MRIIIVGHGHGQTMHFTADNVGSGWENLCLAFEGKWYSLDEAWTMDVDVVLYIGTHPSVNELAYRGGKPPNWRRCVMLQEGGASIVKDAGYALDVFRAGFNGFLVYSLAARFGMFRKPVALIGNAYPFHKHATLRGTPRAHKVMLYLQQYRDPMADAMGTLAVFGRLDDRARGVTFVERDIAPTLRELIAAAGLEDRITVRESTDWRSFLGELATCKVAASMDGRMTWGRLDLDCALVGIRCIGPYTAAKDRLFPECVAQCVDDCARLAQAELDKDAPRYPVSDGIVRDFEVDRVAERVRMAVASMA